MWPYAVFFAVCFGAVFLLLGWEIAVLIFIMSILFGFVPFIMRSILADSMNLYSDDEYRKYYKQAKGVEPSRSTIFWRARGLNDVGFSNMHFFISADFRWLTLVSLLLMVIYVGGIVFLILVLIR